MSAALRTLVLASGLVSGSRLGPNSQRAERGRRYERYGLTSLRILMVTPRFFPETGGVEMYTYQVASRLINLGQFITILTSDRSRQLPKQEAIKDLQVERMPAWPRNRDYYFAPDIFSKVIQSDFDVLHVQSYHTLVPPIAMMAALSGKKPYVVSFHGGGPFLSVRDGKQFAQRIVLRPLLARAAKLIAAANFEIDVFSKALNLPREKFALIPNGADIPRRRNTIGPASRDETLIVSVGRLEKFKGFHRLIRALPFVLKQKPDVRLKIFGDGPYCQDLWSLAEELGVREKVAIRSIPPTERDVLAAELSTAGLFVSFSEYETHPLASLEAISLGCSALVADSPGLRELAEQGLAKVVSLDSADEQVAEAIVAQLNNPFAPKAIQLPSWDDCARSLLAVYRSVTGEFNANFASCSILPANSWRH